MNRPNSSSLLIVGLLTVSAFDLYATTVTLVSSANPVVFGSRFTLTATVSPASATGKVTFYDGVTVLGTATLNAGAAALAVELNVTGKRSTFARYLGDGQNLGAVSAPVLITVNSVAASGFTTSYLDMKVYSFDIAAGDFNNDGRPDIVAVGGGNVVRVALGNGDGTFGAPLSSIVPLGELDSVAVGDFNQDGRQDIVFSVGGGNDVAVSFGNGDGTFSGTTFVPTTRGRIIVADFNADGILDLAVLHRLNGSASSTDSVGILLGNGNGTFGTPTEYFLAPYTYNMIAGDVNNDGKVDLVTVVSPGQDSTREVRVLLGNGSGGFSSPLNGLTFEFMYTQYDSYALEDMNGDGKPDLVLAPGSGYQIGIAPGNGDGTFRAITYFPTTVQYEHTGSSAGISIADVNGDGVFDVLSARNAFLDGQLINFLNLYAGVGDGTVQALGISTASFYYDNFDTAKTSLILADFNRDGRIDIATILDTDDTAVQILEGAVLPLLQIKVSHTGNFTPGQQGATFTLSVNNLPGTAATNNAVTVGNLLSGGLDFVSLSGPGWVCSTTCSRSDPLSPGASYPPITLTVNVQANLSFPQLFAIATLFGGGGSGITDNTDTVDLQVAAPPPAPTLLGPANGSSGVSLPLFYLVWTPASGVTGATSYDVYFGTSSTPPFVGNTSAYFFDPGTLTFGTTYYWRIVGTNSAGSASSATWTFKTQLLTTDFDGNGVPDLVWQDDSNRQVVVNYYGGAGGATYQSWNWLNPTGVPGWRVVAVADFNGDGVPDLVWQNDTSRAVVVNYYGGAGGATYQSWNWLNPTGVPEWRVVAAADFNGDGVPDLVWQNDTSRAVVVNYYGGAGGAAYQSWNWLNPTGVPGWHVVAAADFNTDGVPDLVWQNDTSRAVVVNYYGGSGGAAYQSWNWLNPTGVLGWRVAAAADFDGNGVPDLVWQNDNMRQVVVHYYGGTGGATYQGWGWLNPTGVAGWSVIN